MESSTTKVTRILNFKKVAQHLIIIFFIGCKETVKKRSELSRFSAKTHGKRVVSGREKSAGKLKSKRCPMEAIETVSEPPSKNMTPILCSSGGLVRMEEDKSILMTCRSSLLILQTDLQSLL